MYHFYQTHLITPSLGSCPEFGVSGSGIVREWKQRYWIDNNGVKRPENGPNYDYPNNSNSEPQYQYSFVGPLSMSKGCDLTADFKRNRDLQDRAEYLSNIPEFIYRGSLYCPSNSYIFECILLCIIDQA